MDNRTIFSKTGKGSLEISKKGLKLSGDERQALILVDGKSTLAQLEEKLNRISPIKLRATFEKLIELDLIREFVTRGGPDSIAPSGSLIAGIGVQEITEDDLDFTALAPVASSNAAREVEERRRIAEEAEQKAREEATRRAQQQAEAAAREKVRLAEEARKKVEAEKARLAEEARKAEAEKARLAEEVRKKAEAEKARLAEEARKKAEAEQARLAEEARKAEAEKARLAEEARKKAEAEKARLAEEARKKAEAEQARLAEEARKAEAEKARLAEEARKKAEAEKARLAEEARKKAEAEQARLAEEARKAEAERKAREEAERRAREEAERKAREEAERRAREEAERKAREEAERRAREEAERKAREEAERRAREEAERKAREEAERRAREEAERKAREDAERRAREDAERKAREDAERRAREEAERKAREDAERRAREEAERKAREDAERRAREEAERKAREDAERRAREDAERKAREDAERRAREEAERKAREDAERRAREDAERKAREEAEQAARSQAEARERARLQEEAVRREIAERQVKEEAQRKALEESQRRLREEAERRRRDAEQEQARRTAVAEEQRRAEEEAARYTAALTPHLEDAARTPEGPPSVVPMGAFANLAALESGTQQEQDDLAAQVKEAEAPPAPPDKATLKAQEKEARERAKAETRARKDAEKEARRLAKESASGSGPSRIGVGKIIAGVLLLTVGGATAYIFSVSADKPEIERQLSARFGVPVTVAEAKFTPFPAELRLANVQIGDIRIPGVVAQADPASLASNDKIWRNVDVNGLELTPAQAVKLAGYAAREASRATAVSFTLQRIRAHGVSVVGTPVSVPKFDATISVTPAGLVKQATLALPDGRAQVLLAPEDKGWLVDFESRGVAWPLGPKTAWESLRGKGIASADGIRFDEITLTLGGGVGRATGDLGWNGGWKFAGSIEVSGMDAEAIGNAIYGIGPLSGPFEGKFSLAMSAATLPRLFEAPQSEGNFVVSRAVFKAVDFARMLQGGDPAGGQTRLPELTGSLQSAGGRLQLRQLRGTSGLVTLNGSLDVMPDRSISGSVNVDLGPGGSRGRSGLRVGGTLAEPRFGK